MAAGGALAAILRRVSWRTGLAQLLAGVLCVLCGCGTAGSSPAGAQGTRRQAGTVCDTAVAAAPVLGAVSRAAVPVPGNPFAVAATADGRWWCRRT